MHNLSNHIHISTIFSTIAHYFSTIEAQDGKNDG